MKGVTVTVTTEEPPALEFGLTDASLVELYKRDGPAMWRTLYAYTGGRSEVAEDAMAEAFARALEHKRTIREPLAYIYKVAFRIAAQEMRRNREPDLRGGLEPSPRSEGLSGLVWALRQLSPNQRAAVVLHYEVGLSIVEVAKVMGIKSPTVKVHLFRGRGRLQELLDTKEDEQ
jgi:RNA polymerase sigma-70 factor (ECF subfamily)